jgi:two-component system phosphate regulon sensor histidine kinase PhoR
LSLPRRWLSHFSGLGIWLAISVGVGLWIGAVGWAVAAALAIYIVYTLRNLYMLDRIIYGAGRLPLFDTRGLWAELVARADRIKSRSRNRKKRYHRLLREVRESTGAISDAGIIMNADFEIVWFNRAATTLLGLDPARDIGNRIDNLLRHPDFVGYLTAPRGTSITMPSPRKTDGTLHVQLIPYGKDQRLAIIRDVTHETHLERTRRDFVANASHELRSPLTVITGYLDTMAEDDELPESWQVPITEMLRQSHRMTQILRDLIELTRLESADSEAREDFVDISDMLRDIVAEFEKRKKRPSLKVHFETDAALLGSDSELHSIFYNLIANAVRFTPETGRVDVYWRSDDGAAVCDVVDTGIGIPAELIPRLTERFYRVDTGRSRATGGTGLGLAIVKHALQRHGGRLEIESVEGEGSRFTCRFDADRVVFRRDAHGNVV